MDNRLMKKIMVISVTSVMLVTLSGCGKAGDVSKLDRTSVAIKKDGTIVRTMIEDFTENYYNSAELQKMTEDEINAFVVSRGEGAAKFESLENENGKVKMVLKFGSAADYAEFNSETLSYDSISDAIVTGKIDVNSLIDTKGNPADPEKASAMVNEHVVVASAKTVIAVPYKIKYISPGVKIIDKYIADLSETEEGKTAYIVLNK